MPSFSPLLVFVEVVVLVVVLVFLLLSIAVELLLFDFSVYYIDQKHGAQNCKNRKNLFFLTSAVTPSEFSQRTLNCFGKGLKKRRYDTRERGFGS